MNAKTVLSRIVGLLSTEEIQLTYAKLKDGTLVEASTFDVGEDLFVIGEDGNKTPAPDGEHELTLKDSEGNEVLIKVIAKDGKITERENVELEEDEEEVKPEAPKEEEMEETETPIAEDETQKMGKKIEELAYRIDEMEKKMTALEAVKDETEDEKEEEMEEEELPKLDGAPTEAKLSKPTNVNFGKKVVSAHERVLQRMYNN
jgi:hypothetical protein